MTPGFLLGLRGSLTMLVAHWSDVYEKQPVMHIRWTVGLVAIALSHVLTGRLRRAASNGDGAAAGALRLADATSLVNAVVGVTLVFALPFD